MPSIYDLKPRFQDLLRPLCETLARRGVSANQVTLAAVLLSFAGGALVVVFPAPTPVLLLIPLILFVRMALNAIDGMLAREHDMKSALGAVLNEMGDVAADAMLYLPFALVPGLSGVLVVLLVVAGILVEMVGVVGVQIGATRRYDGPLGKSDRAFVFGLIATLMGLGMAPGLPLNALLALALAMSLFTVYRRAHAALAELEA